MTETTYTQQIDEKTGEIKYMPNTPPPPPKKEGDEEPSSEQGDPYQEDTFSKILSGVNPVENDKLTELLRQLDANNRRLRYDTRLEQGKLDGRRLTAYRTSDKLFKKKAIKHKDYQFTILLDTSGSMLRDENGDSEFDKSKLTMGVSALAQVAKSLESLNIPIALVAMNEETRLLKDYREKYDQATLYDRLHTNFVLERDERCNFGGTSEATAYREVLKHVVKNSHAKTENVVIVLSDGAPNTDYDTTFVSMTTDGVTIECKDDGDDSNTNSVEHLKSFWEKQQIVIAYGVGLLSDAKQIPRSKRLNHIDKLPELMGNLIQEILL